MSVLDQQFIKLNLGCGANKKDGFENVDQYGDPDRVWDLEQCPWPWASDSVKEVWMEHVLEHVGQDPKVFGQMIQELYRVCVDGARVTVIVPHPRHDNFLNDPTHVRAITPNTLDMLSKAKNRYWQEQGASNTPLALYWDVDFELVSVHQELDKFWRERLERGEIDQKEVIKAQRRFNNVIIETHMELKVIKDERV